MAGEYTPVAPSAGPGHEDRRRPRLLAVGEVFAPDTGAPGAAPADITYLRFSEVTIDSLGALRPDVVLSPLVSPEFDCLDLAERLAAAGFRGQYRAVAPVVPNPDLVRREIADRFPALDFDLLLLERHG